MRRISIATILALVALPAWAQTQQQRDWCFGATSTDDQTVAGCTALIQAGQQTTAIRAAAYDDRAFAYNSMGLYDQAIAGENQALALDPHSATAFNTRGNAYYHKGLYSQAIADFTKAITFRPGYANAYYNRGAAYGQKGNRGQAVVDYRAALKFNPGMKLAQDGLKSLGVQP